MNHPDDSGQGRVANGILWTLSTLPLVSILLFYLCLLHARLVLGYWPSPGHPDPKSINFLLFGIHRDFIVAVVVVTSVSPVAWLLGLRMAEYLMPLKSFLTRLILHLASLAAFFLLCRIDPGQFVRWFID